MQSNETEGMGGTVELTAGGISVLALSLSVKLKDATELNDHMELGLVSVERAKQTAAVIFRDLMAHMTTEDIASLPERGSSGKTTNNPDKYSRPTATIKGRKQSAQGSVLNDFADTHIAGRRIDRMYRALQDVADKLEPDNDCAAEYAIVKDFSADKLNRELSKWRDRKNRNRTTTVKAVQIAQQGARFSTMPKLIVDLVLDGDGTIALVPEPIIIWETALKPDGTPRKDDEGKPMHGAWFRHFSVDQFIGLSYDDIKAKGGDKAALIAATTRKKRQPKSGTGGGDQQQAAPKTVDGFVNNLNVNSHFVVTTADMTSEDRAVVQRNWSALQAKLSEKGNEDLIESLTDFRNALSQLVDPYSDVYADLKADKANAARMASKNKTAA